MLTTQYLAAVIGTARANHTAGLIDINRLLQLIILVGQYNEAQHNRDALDNVLTAYEQAITSVMPKELQPDANGMPPPPPKDDLPLVPGNPPKKGDPKLN